MIQHSVSCCLAFAFLQVIRPCGQPRQQQIPASAFKVQLDSKSVVDPSLVDGPNV